MQILVWSTTVIIKVSLFSLQWLWCCLLCFSVIRPNGKVRKAHSDLLARKRLQLICYSSQMREHPWTQWQLVWIVVFWIHYEQNPSWEKLQEKSLEEEVDLDRPLGLIHTRGLTTVPWISIRETKCVIHWIEIFPVDSAIDLEQIGPGL